MERKHLNIDIHTSQKAIPFFYSCSNVFRMPCSTVVPVNPELQQWADDLMTERLRPQEEHNDARRRYYCMRLGNILRRYPAPQVGELLVPFNACSITGELKCSDKSCE